MCYYAYVFEGETTRRDQYGWFSDSYAAGIKIGQTQDWQKRCDQLRRNGKIAPKAIFTCLTREDAELLESALRRFYLRQENAKRNGTDWIENVIFDANKLIADEDLKSIFKILHIQKVKVFDYPVVLPVTTLKI